MSYLNYVKNKLADGQTVIGIWSITNSPDVCEIAAHAELDFMILDMEHGIYDIPTLTHCVRALELKQCSPLFRVPGLQPTVIQNCLDIGAHGIIVPQQQSCQQVMEAVKSCKFPPDGTRGFNPFTRANGYNPALLSAESRLCNQFGLTAVILENKKIFNEIDKILQLPSLNMLYLGIYDLSFDLGYDGNVHHPDIEKLISEAITKIKSAGKYVALMVHQANEIEKYKKLGVNCMVYGVDSNIFRTALLQRVMEFRQYTAG